MRGWIKVTGVKGERPVAIRTKHITLMEKGEDGTAIVLGGLGNVVCQEGLDNVLSRIAEAEMVPISSPGQPIEWPPPETDD